MSIGPNFTNLPQGGGGSAPLAPDDFESFYQSTDRWKALVTVLSIATGTQFVLPMVGQFTTQKNDDGDPGSFSLQIPLAPVYGIPPAQQAQYANQAKAYAAVANPMDIVAIYATRIVNLEGPTSVNVGPPSLPGQSEYGASACVTQLQDPSLLFVGMVDNAAVKVTPGIGAYLRLQGSDLTKIFIHSDAAVPATAQGVYSAFGNNPIAGVLFQLDTSISTPGQYVIDLLDAIVAKAGQPDFQNYSYNWRNFISTSRVDMSFNPFSAQTDVARTLAVQIQSGSAWQNLVILRNSPIARLFVDEYGNLVFDDAYTAWTTALYETELTESEVLDYEFTVSDQNLLTFISVFPAGMVVSASTQETIGGLKGWLATSATNNAVAQPWVMPVADAVVNYGYRYATYQSVWDVTPADAMRRVRTLLTWHNSILFAEVIVRGRSVYKVGGRVLLDVPAHRPEVTRATWYITAVEHEATYGEHWITRLHLRFPMINGTLQ